MYAVLVPYKAPMNPQIFHRIEVMSKRILAVLMVSMQIKLLKDQMMRDRGIHVHVNVERDGQSRAS
jgi:hypothetical protein